MQNAPWRTLLVRAMWARPLPLFLKGVKLGFQSEAQIIIFQVNLPCPSLFLLSNSNPLRCIMNRTSRKNLSLPSFLHNIIGTKSFIKHMYVQSNYLNWCFMKNQYEHRSFLLWISAALQIQFCKRIEEFGYK